MPPLASPVHFLVDSAVQRGYINVPAPELPAAAGGWATLAALRPRAVQVALEQGRGPLAAHFNALPGGATVPLGLGALATAMGSAGQANFRLQRFPDG
jgi:hypothetical protein